MDVRGQNGLIESFFAQRLLQNQYKSSATKTEEEQSSPVRNDRIVLSPQIPSDTRAASPRLLREVQEETQNGLRLIQNFETAEGRTFTRIQDLEITDRGFRRDVLQKNPSGSTSQLEEIFNRQDNGLFQRIQRFTNEIGETQTRIDNNIVPQDAFIISNGSPPIPANQNSEARGTQLDVQV